MLHRARALPGIASATFGVPPPDDRHGSLVAERSLGDPSRRGATSLLWCGPDYFRTLQIAIVQGRPFGPQDDAADTAIVDEDAATYFWPGENPIGQRVRYSPCGSGDRGWHREKRQDQPRRHGQGRVRDVHAGDREIRADQSALIVRTTLETAGIVAALRTVLPTVEPRARITSASAVDALYGPSIVHPRFMALMMSLFAGLALVTAGLGFTAR